MRVLASSASFLRRPHEETFSERWFSLAGADWGGGETLDFVELGLSKGETPPPLPRVLCPSVKTPEDKMSE